MGIINRTPDSFSDGGCFLDDEAAYARADAMIAAGADIIDVGAESTRPGAPEVSAEAQMQRLAGIIPHIVQRGAVASVDTTNASVARHALVQGARMLNSVALEPAAQLAELARDHDADLVLTHCRGSMTAMAGFSRYRDDAYADVVADVAAEWLLAAQQALAVGLRGERLVFDPGLGFTKNASQSLELCARLAELKERIGGHRVLVGASRKSYLAAVTTVGDTTVEPQQRLGASLAAALDAFEQGADILRVHDVSETAQALRYAAALKRQRGGYV